MHPSKLILMAVAIAAAGVHGHPADGTPAARFWEAAIPGTQMPEPLAELVQKGIDHSPLAQNFSGPYLSIGHVYGDHIYVSVSSVERLKAAGTGLFFHEEQLRVGSTMTISFAAAGVPAILPHHAGEKVASFGNLTTKEVITRFNIAPNTEMASQIGDTLRACQAPSHGSEHRACATSVEGIVRAAMSSLGTTAPGQVWVAASAIPRSGLPLRPYVVEAVTPLGGDHHVACHDEPYPYAVFRCHEIRLPATKAYVISLRGGSSTVTMVVICHLDTSGWNPAYPAFEMLHSKPGGASVCHFMPYANLLFGKKPPTDDIGSF